MLGNAMAMLEPESLEEEIRTFDGNLRKVVDYMKKKQDGDSTPERLQ